jgi:hypothetical protein
MMRSLSPFLLLLVTVCPTAASNPDLLTTGWSAHWISASGYSPTDYGVYHFRRSFDLPSEPAAFLIHVSADQRYQLYVNGTRVSSGPARGDLYHWRYESVDIAKQLHAGRNVVAAIVWNFGQETPVAQNTYQTGFLLQGDTAAERILDTNREWKAIRNEAYSPIRITHGEMHGYYVAGPAERVDASKYPWGWETPGYDDSTWKPALSGETAAPRDGRDPHSRYMLVPRPIPMLEESPRRLSRARLAEGLTAPPQFPKQVAAMTVPSNTKARLLLDQDVLTSGYPELTVSGGKGSTVRIGYAESLFLANGDKGNRDDVEGKKFIGPRDQFLPDGGQNRRFRPLWWRTWRYLELLVETKSEPLIIEDITGTYSGYPFVKKAKFEANSPELDRMLEVGWRSLRLCAHETHMDTPYYEQLQYVGDTRIQAMATLYMSGDGRLMRNAIEQINSSRTAEGATYSRAPSALQQYIPGFSLWWIGMVHDYWMYQQDEEFVKQMLPGVRAVLSFFAASQKPDGGLKNLPWWPYVDWVKEWKDGVPPGNAPHDLQLLLAYQWAAHLESQLGKKSLALDYDEEAGRLSKSIRANYWSDQRRLFADDPPKTHWSQHTNALAVIARVAQGDQARDLMERVIPDTTLAQASIYFRYYLNLAARDAGLGDRYLDLLGQWRTMLARGLTTWAEQADPTRSDCHAWGASPNIELYRTVLGIDSTAPGFRRVLIEPHLGKLEKASGAMPHPNGEIKVSYRRVGSKLEAAIDLPSGVEGDFLYSGRHTALKPGHQTVTAQ